MSESIIKVEGLGKKYIIAHEQQRGGYTTLRDIISNKTRAILKNKEQLPAKEEFWALKDVSFDIKQGEAVGIIGRNGAGKSTLLKILSRITEPTTGRIEMNGRVASLLEVGTGFHPELTGRENIFLNGAILGMGRAEIKRKFDEIVDFSGVEKFLDTPVKRYSSGMYVRLAFAVAAHLEPEILVVDEVLAVGDAEFQKKCLGKMQDVSSKDGRTILFVSHDLVAIKTLCSKAIVLNKGEVVIQADTETAVNTYLKKRIEEKTIRYFENGIGSELVKIRQLQIIDNISPSNTVFSVDTELKITARLECFQLHRFNLSVVLYKSNGDCIFNVISKIQDISPGQYEYSFIIPASLLNDGNYSVTFYLVKDSTQVMFMQDDMLSFEIKDGIRDGFWTGKWAGAIRPSLQWGIIKK